MCTRNHSARCDFRGVVSNKSMLSRKLGFGTAPSSVRSNSVPFPSFEMESGRDLDLRVGRSESGSTLPLGRSVAPRTNPHAVYSQEYIQDSGPNNRPPGQSGSPDPFSGQPPAVCERRCSTPCCAPAVGSDPTPCAMCRAQLRSRVAQPSHRC